MHGCSHTKAGMPSLDSCIKPLPQENLYRFFIMYNYRKSYRYLWHCPSHSAPAHFPMPAVAQLAPVEQRHTSTVHSLKLNLDGCPLLITEQLGDEKMLFPISRRTGSPFGEFQLARVDFIHERSRKMYKIRITVQLYPTAHYCADLPKPRVCQRGTARQRMRAEYCSASPSRHNAALWQPL